MGKGYSILVWDDWGSGLVKINPRLHAEGVDMYGNPLNWWACDEHATDDSLIQQHTLIGVYKHYRLVRD